ncbi:MAG TPA: energy-coupling factor ABC transporter permease [Chloroflexota bacterium]|nr:energy-coupling factor ABC transporter permease [Chloroflexota bacterium]
MSHIHIPDGVLPVWLVGAGWLLAIIVLGLVSLRVRHTEPGRQLPLLGVMSALMLVGMSTEIIPIGYHINLSVLAGIVLGPAMSFLAAFIVNLILALFGHGGITVVGLNALVVGVEASLGYYLFSAVWSVLRGRQRTPALSAGIAAFIALVLSSLLMVGVVALSAIGPSAQASASLPESLSFQNPFEHGLIGSEIGRAEEHQADATGNSVDVATFAKLVALFGIAGWIAESLLTGAIVGFVHRVRPDLVGGRSRLDLLREKRVG